MFGNHNDIFHIRFRETEPDKPDKPKKPPFNFGDFLNSLPWYPGAGNTRLHHLNIGVVAISKKDGTPHTGSYHTSGAKVYTSEKAARAALKHSHNPDDYLYVPAIAEISN